MNKKGNLRGSWTIIALTAVIGFMMGCDNLTNPKGGFVAVSSITGVPTSVTVGYLPLYGTVNPAGATNKTIIWSVYYAGETGASISGNTLTTTAAGTVIITATIADGAAKGINYTQSFIITVNPAGGPPSAITYTVTQTGGEDGVTDTTGIVFTFSGSVDSLGLTADNITVSGAAEQDVAATLNGSGASRILSPIIVNAAGLATVAIAKTGIATTEKNVIVYKAGEYVPEYWSITWHLNGGTAGADAQHPTLIVKGALLARPSPDPAKADNTFDGWYTDSALTQTYDFDNPVTANLNLYAKWEAGQTNSDTITYTVEQIGGEDGVTDSTGIVFTFSASVDSLNLTAGNIYVKGEAVKGATAALTESGTIRVLSPITVNAAGLVTVYIIKDGIEAETKHIIVYKAGETVPGTEGLSFELIDNDTAYRVRAGTVTGGAVIIPATYDGLPVTEIGSVDDGWDYHYEPYNNGAFYNTSITSIIIPASVTTIGNYAFGKSLTAITVNDNNPSYSSEGGILYNKAKTSIVYVPRGISGAITIPASVTSIDDVAFSSCTNLTKVIFKADTQLYGIGDSAFSGCTSLTGITIPASVTSIGRNAFYNCTSLTSVIFEAGSQLESIGDQAFLSCTSLTSITLPAGVTSIKSQYSAYSGAFDDCTNLASIMVDGNNQYFASEGGILYNKAKTEIEVVPRGISAVTLPASVTSIGKGFSGCASLTSITVNENNPNYTGEGGILYNKAKTEIIAYPAASGAVTILSSVTAIGDSAFYGCTSLTGITIPANVTSIGRYAFENCENLTNITIPVSVTYVGEYAFWGGWKAETPKKIYIQGFTNGWDDGWWWECNATFYIWDNDENDYVEWSPR